VLRRLAEEVLDRAGVFARRRTDLPRGIDWLLDVARLLRPGGPLSVLDIGANVGQTTLAIRRRFPTARIHAFEPVRSTFETLRANVGSLPNVECHNVALSDAEGSRTIPILPGSVFNSLTSPLWKNDDKAIQEEVRLTTLDRFAAEHGIAAIDILKTDTEGHDLAVLSGARELLSRSAVRCIYTEVTFSAANTQNTPFPPIFELLSGKGYRFMGLYEMDYFQTNPWDASFCNALFFNERA